VAESLHCLVSGRVQGVAFRAFVREQARRLGLTGWVRNLADGRVEVLAQGPQAALDELAACLARGPLPARMGAVDTVYPSLARVDDVEAVRVEHETVYSDFQIKR
jgi:acylphosphatase